MSLLTWQRRWSRPAGTTTAGHAPTPVLRRLVEPGLVGAVGAAGVVLVALVNPERPGHYPVCPTLALTGFYCPGCGGLRAVHALTRGDLGLALHRNPVVVAALPLMTWAYLAWLRRRLLGRPASWYPSRAQLWGVLAFLTVFTVLRNLPAFAWLAP